MKTELDKLSVIVSEEEFLPVVLLLKQILEEKDQLVFLVLRKIHTVGIRYQEYVSLPGFVYFCVSIYSLISFSTLFLRVVTTGK